MKRQYLVLFFLCIILLAGAIAVGCCAEPAESGDEAVNGPVFTVDSVTSETGGTVEVPIRFDNGGEGICGATLRLSIDSALTLTNVQVGTAFSALTLTKPGTYATSTPKLLWDGMQEDESSGVIAVLTLQVPEEDGTYEIVASCEAGDVIDGNLNDVSVAFIPGGITVANPVHIEPDIILPASLTEIGEEAFAGGSFVYVRLDESVTKIGDRAFADCANLRHIYIPAATTSIAGDAFDAASELVIHGSAGSYAEDYADAHGFAFQGE